MKAVILAAGMGTRLGTLIPKPLTSIIDEKTIMDFQIERLTNVVGQHNIMAVVGYKKELIMEKFPDITFVYNPAYTQNNTGKSLLTALRKIEDEDVVWMNGDVFFEPEALDRIMASKYSGVLVDTKKCGEEEIKYTLDSNGNIKELSKVVKKGIGEAVGINFIKRHDLEGFKAELEKIEKQDYFEKALETMSMNGKIELKPIHLDEVYCREIDFVEDLELVRKYAVGAGLL